MSEASLRRLAAVVILAAACNGSSSAPDALTVAADDFNFDAYIVQWRYASNLPRFAPSLFEFQTRVDSGPWTTYPTVFGDSPAFVKVDPATPEGALLSFRLRGIRGGSASEWSSPIAIRRGVRAATDLSVQNQEGVKLSLRWTRRSVLADGLRLERRIVDLDLSKGPWEARPGIGAADTSYEEKDLTPWLDGHAFEYRVIYTLRSLESAPVAALSGFTRPLPPASVNASVENGTVLLTWTNASKIADHVAITRELAEAVVAVVPANPPAARIDGLLPGLHGFQLKAVVGTFTGVINYVSEPTKAAAFVPPPAPTLPARIVHGAAGNLVVRAPDGAFAIACSLSGDSSVEVFPPSGPSYRTSARGAVANGGLFVDAAGAPHLVYLQDSPDGTIGPMPIQHAVLDVTWKVETISTPFEGTQAISVPLFAGLNRAGAVHVLFAVVSLPEPPHHATNAGGTWSEELVQPPEGAVSLSGPVAVRTDGAPIFLTGSNEGYGFVSRAPDGWHVEPVPGTTLDLQPLALFATSPGGALAFFLRNDVAAGRTVLQEFERTSTGWQGRDAGPSWSFASRPSLVSLTMSDDGTRAALVDNADPPMLWLRDGGAWRVPLPLAPDFFLVGGFTPAGKVWVLGNVITFLTCDGGGSQDYVLYEEP